MEVEAIEPTMTGASSSDLERSADSSFGSLERLATDSIDSSFAKNLGLPVFEGEHTFDDYQLHLGDQVLAEAIGQELFDSLSVNEKSSMTQAVREIMLNSSEIHTDEGAHRAHTKELATMSDDELFDRFSEIVASGRGLLSPNPVETFGEYRRRLGEGSLSYALSKDYLDDDLGLDDDLEIREGSALVDLMRESIEKRLKKALLGAKNIQAKEIISGFLKMLPQMKDAEIISRFDQALTASRRKKALALAKDLLHADDYEVLEALANRMDLAEVSQLRDKLEQVEKNKDEMDTVEFMGDDEPEELDVESLESDTGTESGVELIVPPNVVHPATDVGDNRPQPGA